MIACHWIDTAAAAAAVIARVVTGKMAGNLAATGGVKPVDDGALGVVHLDYIRVGCLGLRHGPFDPQRKLLCIIGEPAL